MRRFPQLLGEGILGVSSASRVLGWTGDSRWPYRPLLRGTDDGDHDDPLTGSAEGCGLVKECSVTRCFCQGLVEGSLVTWGAPGEHCAFAGTLRHILSAPHSWKKCPEHGEAAAPPGQEEADPREGGSHEIWASLSLACRLPQELTYKIKIRSVCT